MGLINRLIGNENPKIGVHDWPKAFDMYKRSRLALVKMAEAYELVHTSDQITQVVVSSNKLGLYLDHDVADGEPVFISSTGTIPGGIPQEDAKGEIDPSNSSLCYVVSSNSAQGTIKLSLTKGGDEIDITNTGAGTHFLERLDPDLDFWDETRKLVTSSLGNDDQKLRRRMWDEMAEGIGQLAESRVEFTGEQEFKDELVYSAQYLEVP